MHVALTGISGFLGSYIARHLKHAGHTVTGLVRKTSRTDHVSDFVEYVVTGEQDDPAYWDELLEGADCVIHNSLDWSPLRGSNVDLNAHLQSNLVSSIKFLHAAAPRPFIFISTIAVHHDMRPRWEGMIDEDHPLRPGSLYGACKAAIEAHLWAAHYETGQPTCAFRPCAVYGVDPNLARSYGVNLMRKIKRNSARRGGDGAGGGGETLSKPGGGKFVHVDDVAAAVVAAIENKEDAMQARAFNLVDCYARWADWAQLACEVVAGGVGLSEDEQPEIDFSSPAKPQNEFSKDAVQNILGIPMNRGHDGIREYLRELHDLI